MDDPEYMLTTIDNPYNPHTQYDEWDQYDQQAGHHTSSFLARVVITSHDLSEEDQNFAIQEAIQEIVRENVSGIHKKVLETDVITVPYRANLGG
jgi:hypothetical protein